MKLVKIDANSALGVDSILYSQSVDISNISEKSCKLHCCIVSLYIKARIIAPSIWCDAVGL